MTVSMDQVYPSTQEIIPDLMLHMIPKSLVDQLEERYRALGPKYVTEEQRPDGRYINACMNKSSAQDCLEEVVDAVFNMLVLIFKHSRIEPVIPDRLYRILDGLINIYTQLCVLKELGD